MSLFLIFTCLVNIRTELILFTYVRIHFRIRVVVSVIVAAAAPLWFQPVASLIWTCSALIWDLEALWWWGRAQSLHSAYGVHCPGIEWFMISLAGQGMSAWRQLCPPVLYHSLWLWFFPCIFFPNAFLVVDMHFNCSLISIFIIR